MDNGLLENFNRQVNLEFYSAYLFFAMSVYFDEIAMNGFSKFMKHKASEKLQCAQKIFDYIVIRDEKLTLAKIDEPLNDWINVTDVFSAAFSHEEFMMNEFKNLYKKARDVDDFAALEFILELLDNQIKSVGFFRKLVFRVKNANIITPNIEQLDYMMNERG